MQHHLTIVCTDPAREAVVRVHRHFSADPFLRSVISEAAPRSLDVVDRAHTLIRNEALAQARLDNCDRVSLITADGEPLATYEVPR